MIRIERLCKSYGSVVALDGISLSVEGGTVFGLLGPNGAGKTTTIKILCSLVRPDSGSAEIAGVNLLKDPVRVRSLVGYVPQESTVDPYLTAREHLHCYADLYHLPRSLRDARVTELLELLGLKGHEDRRARGYSGGMKKKLDLACGLIHHPPVIFLDEPSLGLDVPVRRELWKYILGLKEEGRVIFLNTNYMDEAERLCDEVAIIDRGKIAVAGQPKVLQDQLGQDIVLLEISQAAQPWVDRLSLLEEAIASISSVKATEKNGSRLKIYIDASDAALPQIWQAAQGLDIPVQSIMHRRPGLEEVFLHYTGHAWEEGARGDA